MTASRLQHSLMATAVLALAATVTWLSFTQEPADAFLFPRLISVVFLSLALWNFARAMFGMARVGEGISADLVKKILPGLFVAIVFVFFAAKSLGFYVSSTITFLLIHTLYDPTSPYELKGWLRRIVTTAVFMSVIYALFSLLLKVQTPRGMFF
ncbi:MAG: tripartite tricarboxylate transporter TctB family protein [Alphaproteobacteria bacterium]|nr:tripartite tricarboxylate transporter TctB family protein [Alphaproteobacteria bacterium]